LTEQGNPVPRRISIFRDRFFWLAFFIGGFFLLLTLWYSFGMDQSAYAYGAWVWKHYGLPPYIGAFDQNFPGIFIIHRLALALFGESIFGFRLFDFLVQLSSLLMIFYLTKRLSGSGRAGFLAGVFYGIYYYGLGSFDTGQREGYVLWLLLMALILSLTLKNQSRLRAILVGLILGFAFLVKPFYGLSWPVFIAWFLMEGIPAESQKAGRKWAKFFPELCLFAFGCLLPSALIISYYWKSGYLREMYQAVILYNFGAYGLDLPVSPSSPWWEKPVIVVYSISWPNPIIIFSGMFALLLKLGNPREIKDHKLFWAIFFLSLAGLISYWLQGKFFPYQQIPLMALMMIFSGMVFCRLGGKFQEQIRPGRRPVFTLIFYGGLIFLNLISISPDLVDFSCRHTFRNLDRAYLGGLNKSVDTHFSSNNYLAAKKLKEMIQPEDEMEFFGPYPLIPFLLKKKLPSRFGCVQHLLFLPESGPMLSLQKQWINEYTEAVIRTRPRFFLVSDDFPGHTHKFFRLASRSLKQALREKFPELQKFLEQNYQLIFQQGVIEVYELKKASPEKGQ